jgi:membrane-bound ClpP family serine protease
MSANKVKSEKKTKLRDIPARVFMKYTLLQIPGLVIISSILYFLYTSFSYSFYINIIVLLLWILKDMVMFPFIWSAYDSRKDETVHSMIGKVGTTRDDLDPSGYIIIGLERWRARITPGSEQIPAGEMVLVDDIEGLTLIVSRREVEDVK